ncbi:hypothetical protein ACFVT5_24290 [Streptomyces sp. NPDC058001]|uniref:hypothetical protein n=1 Tax=Streptomyces sp. NPDC058001 TaxID=3346300 RepID=UPI0036E129E1
MAKNKNRKGSDHKGSDHKRGSQAEHAAERAQSSSTEARSESQSIGQGTPTDVARKHQRRFGHN